MIVTYRNSNARNDYFTVAAKAATHPVTVVHTAFGTFVCLTCRVCGCEHADATEAFVAAGNGPARRTENV